MKKNLPYAAFTALILLLCLIPSLGMLLPKEESGAGGNQTLSRAPSLRDPEGHWNANYLSRMQDYLGDNFHLRQEMITSWSALNVKVFGSSITEDVVLGSEGWLYFADTLPDYVGLDPMTDREIFSAARNLALIQEYCESRGAKFLFTVAPNKNSLYWANMPDLTLPSARKPRDAKRLAEELERQGVDYLDCFALFRGQEETLYFKTDSHWNGKGAALAADAVNRALGRSSGYFDGPFTREEVHKGDLYDMLYPAGEGLEADPVYSGELTIEYDVPIRSAENLTIMTHGGREGSLVMFRDSFGNNLYPYLADSFDAALFSRSMPYRLDLVNQREADYVAAELVERNLRYLIQNVPVMPAPCRGTESPEGFTVYGSGVNFDLEPSEDLPGYTLAAFSPALSFRDFPAPDADSPMLVSASDGNYYEAFLLEDGAVGLYLPEGVQPLGVACRSPKAPGL